MHQQSHRRYTVNLKEIIYNTLVKNEQDFLHAEDYLLFRQIEDWCLDNLDRTYWRFDYSKTMGVCGVNIPASIIFKNKDAASAFTLRFGK